MDSNGLQIVLPWDVLRLFVHHHCACPVMVVDDQERIKDCNSLFAQWLGLTLSDAVGMPLRQLAQRQGDLRGAYQELFAPHGRRTDSGQRPNDGYSVFRTDVEGRHYWGVVFRKAEQPVELSLLQQFAGSFVADINLGVILVDPDFVLVDISETACRILGLTKERVLNRSMDEVFAAVPPEHQLVHRSILKGAILKNYAVSWTNNQERFELLLDSNLLRDEEGDVVGAYILFKDVTNLRSLEEQVQRSDRLAMIGQIAAGTAHEIRNPLTSIKGFLQVMKNTFQQKEMDTECRYTEIMLTEINRINDLVSEFLLLSKPKHTSFERINVSAVLREILPFINNEAMLHNVRIKYRSKLQLPLIVGDRELLKQVFLNICKNGIEAMVDGGFLTITEQCDMEEQRVWIEIHDTGPGIPGFLIDKIFDPFFTTKEEGTGLGLSVCQRIIHDIGGSLRVASKGYGTTFTVSVPFILPQEKEDC